MTHFVAFLLLLSVLIVFVKAGGALSVRFGQPVVLNVMHWPPFAELYLAGLMLTRTTFRHVVEDKVKIFSYACHPRHYSGDAGPAPLGLPGGQDACGAHRKRLKFYPVGKINELLDASFHVCYDDNLLYL